MFDKSLVVDQRSVTVSELAAGSTNEIHTNICFIEMCELRYKSNFDTYMYCYADFESREMN